MERGSPTATEKVGLIQDATALYPVKGETAFAARIREIILNEARLVKKPTAPKDASLVAIEHYEPDPRKWKDDFLGTKPDAEFNKDSLPVLTAKDGTW